LLAQVADRARHRFGRPERSLRAEPSLILADPQRLEHALGNLIDNALVHGAGD
jgi:signal transduction histidine kinase